MPRFANKKTIILAAIMAVSLGVTAVAETFISAPKDNVAAQTKVSSSLIARGEFQGRAEHVAGGEAFVLKTSRGYVLVLSYEFSADESQSAVLGFGQDGEFVAKSRFASLRAKSGRQTYILPESVTPTDFNEIYVWSEVTETPISVAALY